MKQIITKSEAQTLTLGKKIAHSLKGGETIALVGDLGAGKTVLVRGLAQGLGVKNVVNSPTFVLMKVYKISKPELKIKNLIHVDAYRLNSGQCLVDIGILDWLGRKDSVVLIEWAERVRDLWPKKITKIYLRTKSPKERIIKIITVEK
jgi:tRNA threonylcarbamoyladenosine biosynthesis protein TsaE